MTALVPSDNGAGQVFVHYGGVQNGVETYVLTTNSETECTIGLDDDLRYFSEAKKAFYDCVAGYQYRLASAAGPRAAWDRDFNDGQSEDVWNDDYDNDIAYDPLRYTDDSGEWQADKAPDSYSRAQNLLLQSNNRKTGKAKSYSRLTINPDQAKFPGPGAYNTADKWKISNIKSAPSYSFHGVKAKHAQDPTPAPGHYTSSAQQLLKTKYRTAPEFSMGAKPADIEPVSDGPGPAAHAVTEAHTNLQVPKAPAYSIGGRNKQTEPRKGADGPGPAYFNPAIDGDSRDVHEKTSTYKRAPAFSIYGPHKKRPPAPGPGPGAYVASDKTEKHSFAAFIGTAKKSEEPRDGPGPNQYNTDIESMLRGNGGFKFGQSNKLEPKTIGPGPGKYHGSEISENNTKNAGFTIAGRTVAKEPDSNLPGPAQYLVEAKKEGPSFSMGKASRAAIDNDTDGPGPGKYGEISTKPSGPSATMLGRYPEKKLDQLPGPAQYVAASSHTVPSFSMKGPERALDLGPSTPGPGPGKYADVSMASHTPHATLVGRPSQKKPDDLPGPGNYVYIEQRSVPSFSMKGSGPRAGPSVITPGPGPGKYGDVSTKMQGPHARIIGRPPVKKVSADDQMRGPGTHVLPTQFTEVKQDSKTMGKPSIRKEQPLDTRTHGMSHNEDPFKTTGPAFKIGGRHKEAKVQEGPGPGQYLVDRTNTGKTLQKDKGARIIGRTKERVVLKSEQLPGPGAYIVDLTSTGESLKATFGARIVGRPRERKLLKSEQTPGPGAFDIDPIRKMSHTIRMMPPSRR